MTVYIETERLRLRDWREEDLLPFQQMNANQQVRRYFPSLLSYRRSEHYMYKMVVVISLSNIGLYQFELNVTNCWLGFF
ncbi:GNAT family N-acetyltransferase, partial [Staphylococcus xylosus]|uniref:GNAT family N-acetyltransferase n=1 Tax=Staphylococcus shinii TaxID=2912228 RepID=UPI000FF79E5E